MTRCGEGDRDPVDPRSDTNQVGTRGILKTVFCEQKVLHLRFFNLTPNYIGSLGLLQIRWT